MSDTALIGQVINGYQVVAPIARGGMATVYRAHQISMNRDVALKVLPREFLHEPSFLERFKQEAAIAARLEHRAIVPIFDYGQWEGVPYIVMRYMDGGSVDSLLQKGLLPLEKVQQIVRQVASGLDHAHKQGVLHRDLKPSNILLDRSQDAYISDFGIARLTTSDVKLTATGVVGTPAYMSPEQAQGLDLDGRSDVYALGVVLYEMLTCRRPFESETPYGIAVMHVTKPPTPPRAHNAHLPEGVEVVILKALEKDPQKRYQSATALAGALDDADLLAPSAADVETQIKVSPPSPLLALANQPTPRRIQPAVLLPSQPAYPVAALPRATPIPTPKPRRRSSGIGYLLTAFVVAVALSSLLLGVYLAVPLEPQAVEPNFSATGAARLTATALAPTVTVDLETPPSGPE